MHKEISTETDRKLLENFIVNDRAVISKYTIISPRNAFLSYFIKILVHSRGFKNRVFITDKLRSTGTESYETHLSEVDPCQKEHKGDLSSVSGVERGRKS